MGGMKMAQMMAVIIFVLMFLLIITERTPCSNACMWFPDIAFRIWYRNAQCECNHRYIEC